MKLKGLYYYVLSIMLGVALLLPSNVTAQTVPPSLRFGHLTANEGLPGRHVLAIFQDRQGFMWFGTEDGLAKYDGYRFIIYRNDPDNPQSLSASAVNALYEDPEGYVWIGTVNGLNRFDPATESFTHYLSDGDDSRGDGTRRGRRHSLGFGTGDHHCARGATLDAQHRARGAAGRPDHTAFRELPGHHRTQRGRIGPARE